jgi:hypothetical protein
VSAVDGIPPARRYPAILAVGALQRNNRAYCAMHRMFQCRLLDRSNHGSTFCFGSLGQWIMPIGAACGWTYGRAGGFISLYFEQQRI